MEVKIKRIPRKKCTAVRLDYVDQHGKRHRRVVGTGVTDAELAELEVIAERDAARIHSEVLENRHTVTGKESIDGMLVEFDEHLEAMRKADRIAPSTMQSYRESIKKFRRFLGTTRATRLEHLTPQLIVRYIHSLDGKAANTINGELTRLQRILRRCVDNGKMTDNPVTHKDVKEIRPQEVKRDRAFKEAELRVFLPAVAANNRSPDREHYADFFLLLARTGLRLGEGRMLRWIDVHMDDDRPFVRVSKRSDWRPKSKRSERTVPLAPDAAEMLRRRLERVTDISGRVFPDTWTNRSVNQCFNRCLKREGLHEVDDKGEKLTVHSLRHYYATDLVNAGADPATVRDLLGHSCVTVTNRYFNSPREELFRTTMNAFSIRNRVPSSVPETIGFERSRAENVR